MSEEGRPRGVFSRMAVVWLVLVGALSGLGLLILSAYGPQLRSGNDGGAHALSRSAVGFAGLARLLKAQGDTVVIARGPLRLGTVARLIIETPAEGNTAEQVAEVDIAGPRLVILPKWRTVPNRVKHGWVYSQGMVTPHWLETALLKGYAPRSVVARRDGSAQPRLIGPDGQPFPSPGRIRNLQTFTGPYLTPVVTDESGGIVLARVDETYFLADPDLMNTQGVRDLRTAQTAMAIVHLVSGKGTPIVFDVTLAGYKRSRNVLQLMFDPPFLGATLCLGFAALLLAMQAAVRFGAPRPTGRAFALGKAALVDNTAALVRMAKREHRMAERYALASRTMVAKAIGAPDNLQDEALNAFIDRAGAARGATAFSGLLTEARRAAKPSDVTVVARKLYEWRLEMTRERR